MASIILPIADEKPTQIAVVRLSALPPSVNNCFVNKPGGGRFKSKEYKAWQNSAGWELYNQKPGKVLGPYAITLTFGRRNKRADLDNLIKATSDLLVTHRVVEGDHLAQRIIAEWGPVVGCHIQVASTKERA